MYNEKRPYDEVIALLMETLVICRLHLEEPESEIAEAWSQVQTVAKEEGIVFIR